MKDYKSFTFTRGGIHPHGKKELSKDAGIAVMPAPKTLAVALSQSIGKPSIPVVSAGDAVKAGQLIAKADGHVSANIHSPVSGKITAIEDRDSVLGVPAPHIIIENDGMGESVSLPVLKDPDGAAILKRVQEAGIVGMGGAGFPTHVKLSPPKDKPIDTLIINAAECEPYITCDYRIILEYPDRLCAGALMLAKTLGLSGAHIGIEDNKPDAISSLSAYLKNNNITNIHITALKARYPQGAEKQLIWAVKKRAVPAGGLPMDIGVIVCNAHTALSTYEAVAEGKPLYERIITVSGGGIERPGNIRVPFGTSYADIAAFCGGEKSGVLKIVNGGPMMGIAQVSREVAVNKTTSSILFLSEKEFDRHKASACINCGACARSCPMNLMPMYIDSFAIAGDFSGSKKYGAADCIECGCCTYVCPAKRPLIQSIKLAKKKIRENNL